MTRIVGGSAKGRRLSVPPQGTRPTSDRAREALFNSVATLIDLDGAHMLDLFAGSGAVGLEALSRGAESVTFVESDRAAADVLNRNIAALALPGAHLVRSSVAAFLDAGPDVPFHLAFADPPYAVGEDELGAVLTALGRPGWLAPDGVIVLERSARSPEPGWPECVTPLKRRRYGEGVLWYGRRL